MIYDVLIIGAGPSGLTAGIYAKRAGLNVLVFEGNIPGGQIVNTAEIENYTGFQKLSGFELATHMIEHATSMGVEIVYERVLEVEVSSKYKKVVTEEQTYETKAVIVASGTTPRKLGVENEDMLSSNGISWCAICDGPIYKNQDVVVIGGGNSAVEEAYYLSTLAKSVTIIQDLDKLTAHQKAIDTIKKATNVSYYLNAKVLKFEVNELGVLEGVRIQKEGKEIFVKAQGVFEYIGLIPQTEFLQKLNILDSVGYVKANEHMQTDIKGIFAIGDVRVKPIRQIVTAVSDGAVANQNVLKYLEEFEN